MGWLRDDEAASEPRMAPRISSRQPLEYHELHMEITQLPIGKPHFVPKCAKIIGS